MGANRIHFADDEDKGRRPEPRIWVTRAFIAGILIGLAAAAHVILGIRLI